MPTLLGALGVLAVGMGFNNPSLSSMVSRLADPDDQGGMLGLASSICQPRPGRRPGVGRLSVRRLRHDHAVPERGGDDDDRVLRVVDRAAERSSRRYSAPRHEADRSSTPPIPVR